MALTMIGLIAASSLAIGGWSVMAFVAAIAGEGTMGVVIGFIAAVSGA